MTMIKLYKMNILLLLVFTAAVQCLAPAFPVLASTVPAPPIVNAGSVYILEARTGQELYSKNAEESIYTDSLLPMLISMVVADQRNIDDFVIITEEAQGMSTRITGSRGDTGLTAGERLTIRQLLSAVLLASSQDASRALAGIFEKDDADLLALLKEKAEELELKDTVLESYLAGEASGKTTVRDMALVMQAFLGYSQLKSLARQPSNTFIPTNMVPEPRIIENRNLQVLTGDDNYYENAAAGFISDGITASATYNMYVTASEDEQSQFIVALSNSNAVKDNFTSSRTLFDWTRNNYRSVKLISQGETLSYLPLENGSVLDLIAERDVYHLASRNLISDPDFSVNFKPMDTSTDLISKNQVMGTADIVIEEKVIASLDLLAEDAVNLTLLQEEPEEGFSLVRSLGWAGMFLLTMGFLSILVLILSTVNKIRKTRARIRRIQARQKRLLRKTEEEFSETHRVVDRQTL